MNRMLAFGILTDCCPWLTVFSFKCNYISLYFASTVCYKVNCCISGHLALFKQLSVRDITEVDFFTHEV